MSLEYCLFSVALKSFALDSLLLDLPLLVLENLEAFPRFSKMAFVNAIVDINGQGDIFAERWGSLDLD